MSSVKFHQLPVANDSCNRAPRDHDHDMSPIKSASVANQLSQHLISLQQIQQQQQRHQQEIAVGQAVSDDEDDEEDFDELNGAGNFYESLQALNQQQQRGHLNQAAAVAAVAAAANMQSSNEQQQHQQQGSTTTTANSFLMDKNKKLFPQKLWELIHNPSIQHCLRWSQDGQRVYLNRNEFEQYYLKTPNNQFHTQKAISFVRQMNMYGFRKVDDCYYENDNFRRDRKHLLKNMIRRHPNKGLFVGLDHHQLAAAAAAQQALQVNQQLQQLESQHKQRAEQALRLNNYLSQQHQQHPAFQTNFAAAAAAAAAAASMNMNASQQQQQSTLSQQQQQQQQQQQTPLAASMNPQHHHSSSFERMSSQLAAASHHYSQQLAQQQQQQQFGENLTMSGSSSSTGQPVDNPSAPSISPTLVSGGGKQSSTIGKQQTININQQQQHQKQAFASAAAANHQTKKSRLLNNFYASQQQQLERQQQRQQQANGNQLEHLNLSLNQASSHIDFQAALQQAQADIIVKSPALATNHHHSNNNNNNNINTSSLVNGKLNLRPMHTREAKFNLNNGVAINGLDGHLDGNAAAAAAAAQARHAALHETLVRSLLQLKQNHHHKQQDLVAALAQHQHQQHHHQQQQQQQSQRTLLESLASLSSAGTGSIVDPASNSPTERTATPPSGPPSPDPYSCDNMALDLAKSTQHHRGAAANHQHNHHHHPRHHHHNHQNAQDNAHDEDYAIEVDDVDENGDDEVDADDEECNARPSASVDNEMAASPLDGTKKVRKFLEDQMARSSEDGAHEDEVVDQTISGGGQQQQQQQVEGDAVATTTTKLSIKRELAEDDAEDGHNHHSDEDDDDDHVNDNEQKLNSEMDNKQAIGSPAFSASCRGRKRARRAESGERIEQQDLNIISKLLVSEICNRRGDQLNEFALDQAAKYTQCFLDTLIDDASLIASHALVGANGDEQESHGREEESEDSGRKQRRAESQPIDVSSLSLALKLIPAKLIAAIQQQQGASDTSQSQSMLLSQETEQQQQQQQQQVAVDS